MKTSRSERFFVYTKGNMPAQLSNWAKDAGIEMRVPAAQATYFLYYSVNKLKLRWLGDKKFLPISAQTPGQKRVSSSNLLIKALGKRNRIIADLSAGLGVDALTIASTGRRVYCIERCPAVAMLLFDGISRCDPTLADLVELHFENSKFWLEQNSIKLDAIYIDTMFIGKKKSAKPSKQMQILRQLAGDDRDAELLINCALKQNVSRVIVKKYANAAACLERPVAQYRGKTIRFDVFKPGFNK